MEKTSNQHQREKQKNGYDEKLKISEFVGMENLKWSDMLYFNSVFAETYC